MHGFINCQKLKLTANRGTIANTNAQIISDIINEINMDLYKHDVMTLRKWKEEAKTKKFEEAAFNKRRELITRKQYFVIGDRTFLVPRNEAELYGVIMEG